MTKLEERIAWRVDWIESERGFGKRDDGCSLHVSEEVARAYVQEYNDTLPDDHVPDCYARAVSSYKVIVLDKEMFSKLQEKQSLRYWEWDKVRTAKPQF
jgi:hypothetical protein